MAHITGFGKGNNHCCEKNKPGTGQMQTGKKCQGSAYIFFTVTKEYIIVHFTSSHAG